jgi:murein L,D-transpeptidase YafK
MLVATFVAATTALGCSASPGAPVTTEASATHAQESIERFQLALFVQKSRQILGVYRYGELVREYPIVIGSHPDGNKLYEGDLRTPEGLYRITHKRPHPRWLYFLELDYPNPQDVLRYDRNLQEGRIPVIADRPLGIGNSIGIHGSDRPAAQARGRNWTKGCIALTNEDIAALHDTVRLGTPVLIVP